MDHTTDAGAPRRHFRLSEGDEEYLNSTGLRWETVSETIPAPVNWLVIYGFAIPPGYNVQTASVALVVDGSYPDTQIDMVYFLPGLSRSDNVGVRNLTLRAFDGNLWQQWSRHRTEANPWRPGVDGVATHLMMFTGLLEREFGS